MESEQQEGNGAVLLGRASGHPAHGHRDPSLGYVGLPRAGGSSLWGCSLRDCLVRPFLRCSDQPQHEGAQLLPKPSCNFTC